MTALGPIQPRRITALVPDAEAKAPALPQAAVDTAREGDSLSVSERASAISRGAQELRSRLADASSKASTGDAGAFWLDRVNAALERTRRGVDAVGEGGTGSASAVRLAYESRLGAVVLSGARDNVNLASPSGVLSFVVRGVNGSVQLSFSSGTSLRSIADAVGSFTEQTGVRAELVAGKGVEFRAVQDSFNSFVSVEVVSDGGQVDGGWGVSPR